MALLLGSRGQYRGRSSGFLPTLRHLGGAVLQFVGVGRSSHTRRGETRASRGSMVSGWIALGAAVACFGAGYLVGNATSGPSTKGAELNANGGNGPVAPAVLSDFDARPLTNAAFIVAAYPGLVPDEAKLRAKTLSDWLKARQLPNARPYEYPSSGGPLWVVAVYHDGGASESMTRERLRGLPEDAPDEMFVHYRKDGAEDWPKSMPIR